MASYLFQSALIEVLFSVQNRMWKIADFGFTVKAASNEFIVTDQSRGKAGYRAPELLKVHEPYFGKASDIWSLGCITYELCTGEKLFENDHAIYLYAERDSPIGDIDFKEGDASSVFKPFIEATLAVDPSKRPTAKNLLDDDLSKTLGLMKFVDTDLATVTMQWAISNGDMTVVRMLLEMGMQSFGCYGASDDFVPIEYATQIGNTEVVEMMLTLGGKQDPILGYAVLSAAIKRNDAKMLEMLIDGGVSCTESRWADLDPLFLFAVANKQVDIVSLLLEEGLGPEELSEYGGLAVFAATMNEDTEMITALELEGFCIEPAGEGTPDYATQILDCSSKNWLTASTLAELPLPSHLLRKGPSWFAFFKQGPSGTMDLVPIHTNQQSRRPHYLRFSSTGRYIAVISKTCVEVLRVDDGSSLANVSYASEDHSVSMQVIDWAQFGMEDSVLFTADTSHYIILWDLSTGSIKCSFVHHEYQDRTFHLAIDVCHDGSQLATAGIDEHVLLWDAQSGRISKTLTHLSKVQYVGFCGLGKFLAVGEENGNVSIWDTVESTKLEAFSSRSDSFCVDCHFQLKFWEVGTGGSLSPWEPDADSKSSIDCKICKLYNHGGAGLSKCGQDVMLATYLELERGEDMTTTVVDLRSVEDGEILFRFHFTGSDDDGTTVPTKLLIYPVIAVDFHENCDGTITMAVGSVEGELVILRFHR
jgi:WD40 repeat protein